MFPVAWIPEYAQHTKDIIGDDIFPYGIEKNRVTLEAWHHRGIGTRVIEALASFVQDQV